MWLEAIITQEDVAQVVGDFLPVKIYLDQEGEEIDEDRWLLLQPATEVALVAGEGLRVTCPAQFSWSIAGVSPTITIDELRILLTPEVVEKNKGMVLEFGIKVEKADVHHLPDFIDSKIVDVATAALATKRPSWNFAEMLTRTVSLGKLFDPIEALKIEVSWGEERLKAEALVLVISFKLSFVRRE
jgi:hypothetical protein